MKKVFSFLLILAMFVTLLVPSASAVGVSLFISDGSGERGSSITLDISVSGNTDGIGTATITVDYPKDYLELTALDLVKFVGASNPATGMAVHTGAYSIMGDGVLVSATFKVKDNAPAGNYTVTVFPTDFYDNSLENELQVSSCSGTIKVSVPPCAEHSWEVDGIIQKQGCETDEITHYVCSVCSAEKNETTAKATGHNWVKGDVVQELNCLQDEMTRYTCSRCNVSEDRKTQDASGHDWGDWTPVEGNDTHSRTCGNANCPVVTETVNHTWDETSRTPATCVNPEKITYACSDCGATKTVDGEPATGVHTYTKWTNNDDGTHSSTCDVCKIATDTKDHTWDNGTVTKEPTCDEKGVKTYTCTANGCTATRTEEIPATGKHTYTTYTKVDDEKHTSTCKDCGKYPITEEHKWDDGVITQAPTCTKKGVKTYTCTANGCTATRTEEIAATGVHTFTTWEEDEGGKTHTSTCDVCKEATKTEDHTWDKGKVTKEPTCAEEGVKTYACTAKGCTATKTEPIAATGEHDFTKHVDNGDGTHSDYCKFCNTAKVDEKGTVVEVKHEYTQEGEVTLKPTTTSEGKQEMLCVCGAKTEKVLPKVTADYDDVPKTGDITNQLVLSGAAVVLAMAAAVYLLKRRLAK